MRPSWRKNYLRYKTFFLNILRNYRQREDTKVYLELLLSLITISLFLLFAIRPTILTITTLYKDIEAKKTLVAKMDEKVDLLKKADSSFKTNSETIKLLDIAMPENPMPDKFFRQIEGLSGKNNSAIATLSIDGVALIGTPVIKPLEGKENQIIFSYTNVGEYNALIGLLKDIEKLRRPVLINGFVFTANKTKEGLKFLTTTNIGSSPFLNLKVENKK